MVIRKMNSIFSSHGKYIFSIITLAIIVSFLGFMTPQFLGIFAKNPQQRVVGKIFGDNIMLEDLRFQIKKNLLIMELMTGRFGMNSQLIQMAEQTAYPYLCEVAVAKQRKITVSKEEIAGFIRALPRFKKRGTGEFDKAKYSRYVKNLEKNNYSVKDLEAALRSYILCRKLNNQITENIIVTPSEVRAFYNDYNEKFTVRAARFKAGDFIKQTTLAPAEIKKYFESNRGLYKMPEKFLTLIIKFNYVDAEKDAVKMISDKALKDYYEKNKASFKTIKGKQKEFAAAKDQVMKKLVREKCRELTLRKAQIFARDVYEKIAESESIQSQLAEFRKFAKLNKLEIYESEWIDAKSTKICKRWVEPELVKQIVLTYEKIPVSNAVAGSRCAFVAFVKDKRPERKAGFAEVKDVVTAQLRQRKALQKARDEARNFSLKMAKLDKKEVLKALDKSKVKFEKIDSFMVRNPPYGPDGAIIAGIAEKLQPGTISMPEETANGALLVYVESRTLPKAGDFAKDKEMAEKYYTSYKLRAARVALNQYIRANCRQPK